MEPTKQLVLLVFVIGVLLSGGCLGSVGCSVVLWRQRNQARAQVYRAHEQQALLQWRLLKERELLSKEANADRTLGTLKEREQILEKSLKEQQAKVKKDLSTMSWEELVRQMEKEESK